MGDPHHYEKAARYARAAWLGKSAPGPEKLGISYPGVPDDFEPCASEMFFSGNFSIFLYNHDRQVIETPEVVEPLRLTCLRGCFSQKSPRTRKFEGESDAASFQCGMAEIVY